MKSLGDICPCGDLALPGQDLCPGCLADLQAERAQFVADTAALTEAHEAAVQAEDVVA